MSPRTVLILGGTHEAHQLAEELILQPWLPNLRLLTSLAGSTRTPRRPPGEVRVGGFGGAEGLAKFLHTEAVAACVDATHPYAAQISGHAVEAAQRTQTPLLRWERPPWEPALADRWVDVADLDSASRWISGHPHRVLLTTGLRNLEAFQACLQSWFLVRTIEPPQLDRPWPQARFLQARGPFTLDAEVSLMQQHRISLLVTKNSGGSMTQAKLEAARQLNLPVLMVQRPRIPPALTVSGRSAVVDWLRSQLA
jgi:precorrin-6A/cobalt-precorrin-6A reductase